LKNRSTAKLTLHRCRQDGGDPWRRIAAILAAVMQSEFCGTAKNRPDRLGKMGLKPSGGKR
jgi:hypothetical protein